MTARAGLGATVTRAAGSKPWMARVMDAAVMRDKPAQLDARIVALQALRQQLAERVAACPLQRVA